MLCIIIGSIQIHLKTTESSARCFLVTIPNMSVSGDLKITFQKFILVFVSKVWLCA